MRLRTQATKKIVILAAGAVALMAGHGVVFYYLWSHKRVSVPLLLGMIALLVAKHLGFVGPVYALLRRRHTRLQGPPSGLSRVAESSVQEGMVPPCSSAADKNSERKTWR